MNKQLHKGDLLIAEPSIIGDASFHRAVVLITAIHDHAPMGFVLNKPFDFSLAEVVPEVSKPIPLYCGGPVDPDNLFFIHSIPDHIDGSISISPSLFFGGNIDHAIVGIEKGILNSSNSRFFLGYSGWSKGQLEQEIASKSWFTSANTFEEKIVSHPAMSLWKNLLLSKGGEYRLWANAPNNPAHN